MRTQRTEATHEHQATTVELYHLEKWTTPLIEVQELHNFNSRKDTQLSQLKKEDTVTTTCVHIWGKYITTATTKAAVSPITTNLNT
jgi:hypothetical protein